MIAERALFRIISDCMDDNARSRVTGRLASVLGINNVPDFIGVKKEIEAAINIVDSIDAFEGALSVLAVNIAPRGGKSAHWPNGCPFGLVKVNNTYIFTTVDGLTLSLLKKIIGPLKLRVFPIEQVLPRLGLAPEMIEFITDYQFRSYQYLPLLIKAVFGDELPLPFFEYHDIPDAPLSVALVDCFGNVKTTMLSSELGLTSGEWVRIIRPGMPPLELYSYHHLKDVPNGETAIVEDSSGMFWNGVNHRFVGIVKRGGPIPKNLDLKAGKSFVSIAKSESAVA